MSGRVWLGLFLIICGAGFLMHQAELLDFTKVLSMWWPLILIIIGIIQLIYRTYSSAISGLLFVLIGGLFLVGQFIEFNIVAYIWPIILIFIGLVFIFSRVNSDKAPHTSKDINAFSLFSGCKVRSQSSDFTGGSATTIFGGAEIDLREALISGEKAKMDLTTIFGGIVIRVPEDMQVEISGFPIFGGWDNKTVSQHGDDMLPVLKLNCLAIFGGVEVKN